MKRILAIIAAALMLSGCASETETMRDAAIEALQIEWDATDSSDQAAVCLIWLIDPDMWIKEVLNTHEGHYLFRNDVEVFFDRECDY